MKKTLLAMFIFASSFANAFAQENDKITQAFLSSYSFENSKLYGKAIDALVAVYSADNYEVNFRLGWLFYVNGDYVKAQSYYKKAIQIEPSSVEAKLGYVMPTAALENWDDVLNTYKEVLKTDPNNSLINYRAASILYLRKDFNAALSYLQKLISLYPFDYDANVLLAKTYVGLGKITEAKKHFQKALNYSPQSQEVINALKNL
jgi:tetratricopeptide (TPR) repeat protein